MTLLIEDGDTVALVGELARRLKTSEQSAIRIVVEAELGRLERPSASVDERLARFYARFPKPEPTGLAADKAFYDELSGENE